MAAAQCLVVLPPAPLPRPRLPACGNSTWMPKSARGSTRTPHQGPLFRHLSRINDRGPQGGAH